MYTTHICAEYIYSTIIIVLTLKSLFFSPVYKRNVSNTRQDFSAIATRPANLCAKQPLLKKQGDFFEFFSSMYCIQHCFICRPSDSSVPDDAGIEPRTVATSA